MSENQLASIEAKIDRLVIGQAELRHDVGILKTDVQGLKADVQGLKTDVEGLKTDGRSLKEGQTRLEGRMDRLEILHEVSMDAIKQIAESHAVTQALVQRGFDEFRERYDRRFDLLEAVVRDHSLILNKHNLTL